MDPRKIWICPKCGSKMTDEQIVREGCQKCLMEGMKITHTVIKNEDIEAYLSNQDKQSLTKILNTLALEREVDKKLHNTYLIINLDEPYANEIISILKRNGHWN